MSSTLTLILIVVVAISVFSIIVALVKRYKRCPSDKLLVIYGKTGKTDGKASAAKVIHGGGAFVWPVIQDYTFLDLKPISIDINLKGALSKQNIRIDVPSVFTVAISGGDGIRENAAEKLLGLQKQEIAQLAQDIILGQMRLVIAMMNIEEINADRDKFLENIQKNLEDELQKIGLRLINVNITDISDESNYIKSLGQNAASGAINEAAIQVAQKNKDGAIGVATADREKRVSVAAAQAEAQIGEADASQKMRAETAALNAKAIAGENSAFVEIAKTNASRQIAEADAKKDSVTAENVKAAEAKQASYDAEKLAETKRAERDKATQYANIVVPAEIAKEKLIVEAAANAESTRVIAKGDADAMFAKMEAEARGINEILTKQAEGFAKLVQAAGGDAAKAVQLMIADKLPELTRIQVDAIKNIKFDKITVWDNGGNGSGNSTANFAKNLFSMIPPLTDIFKQVGAELPAFMQGAGEQKTNELEAENSVTKVIKDETTDNSKS